MPSSHVQLEPFDPARFEQLRIQRGVSLGRPCRFSAITGSTNSDLMQSARDGAPSGTLHVADLQTHGRGRHGNRWESPRSAENLLFSVLLRPNIPLEVASNFTLAVGLALRDAVQPHLAQVVGIKWTNDVYVENRKLAGILVESQIRESSLAALVVGIGLNVHMTQLPEEIADIATSLRLLDARCVERESLLVDVLAAVEQRTEQYERHGFASMLDELRTYDAIFARRVRVGDRTGVARGITSHGALLLDQGLPEGIIELTSGLVEILD